MENLPSPSQSSHPASLHCFNYVKYRSGLFSAIFTSTPFPEKLHRGSIMHCENRLSSALMITKDYLHCNALKDSKIGFALKDSKIGFSE
ncbi:hypothetical protein TNCV_2827221 [Trichonephila clavipes]|nr:hypothetical protein TNCV_2827221 [Trichonephila clavipes]